MNEKPRRAQFEEAPSRVDAAVSAARSSAEAEVKVLGCINCEGPVASSSGKCFACGSPLTGREFPYIHRQPAGPDISGMVKWWAIFSVLIFAVGGFSFGVGSTLAFAGLTTVYGVRILRAYFL
jgi:hypothetical protein